MAVLDVIKRSKGTARFFSLLKQPAKTVTERAVELATSVYAGTLPEQRGQARVQNVERDLWCSVCMKEQLCKLGMKM